MKRVVLFLLVGTVSAASAACQAGAGNLGAPDQAAIRKVVDDAAKMVTPSKTDYADYVKLYYADDAAVLASNAPAAQGHAAIQAALQSFPPMSDFKLEIVELDGRGDLAYVRGNYSMTMNPPGAPAMADKGKYVEIWKKQADGSWKVRYDSFSSDLPAPGLMVPTGAVAPSADAEVKKLGDIVGRWQIGGTFKPDPKKPAGPVAMSLDCQWFAGGLQVVCAYTGASAGQPYQEADIYSYDSRTKTYTVHSVSNPGGAMTGKVTIQPGTWTQVSDFQVEGKPAKMRLTMTDVTPAGGTWKNDMSVAGGPWMPLGDGKYAKAR
jgi:ketosteroid isomerase-like protein